MSTNPKPQDPVSFLTWLYVPGDRPDRVQKALASEADAVIVDLEDAVDLSSKARARAATAELLTDPISKPVFVRVNGFATAWTEDDVVAIRDLDGLAGIRFPKVESVDQLDVAEAWLGDVADDLEVQCLIESALGIEASFQIASHRLVASISLGEADLRADLGVSSDEGFAWLRGRIVVAARAAGLPSPVQSAYTHLRDPGGLAQSCALGKRLGFFGRTAIHPEQLPTIVQAYLPTTTELASAQEIVDAAASATDSFSGSIALPHGRFVDRAVVAGAIRTMQIAERYGTTE